MTAAAAWLATLPDRVAECLERWRLLPSEPFLTATGPGTLPVRLPGGGDAVLKLAHPHRESEHEGLALRTWNGDGAVRLIDEDVSLHALLIERCVPGTPLSEVGNERALAVLIDLLPRLWKPATSPPFRSLAAEAAWWAADLRHRWEGAGRPFEERILDAALDALATLPATQGEPVLLHQDLHGDNVLRAQREPWLVIDPKPLAGERELGLAPIIRSAELGPERRDLARRLDRLTAELGLDRQRARLWCVVQSVAWSFDGGEHLPGHIAVARWLLDA